MRILHVNKFLYRRGGAEGYMLDVADLQRAQGDEVELFGTDDGTADLGLPFESDLADYLSLDPPPDAAKDKLRAAAKMFWNRDAERGMEAVLTRFRPDVVHLHNIYHQLSPSILRPVRRQGVPAVMTLHDYKLVCPTYQMLDNGTVCEACLPGHFSQAVRRRCRNGSLASSGLMAAELSLHTRLRSYAAVQALICPSRFMLDTMVKGGIEPSRLHHLPHPVEAGAAVKDTPGGGVVFAGRLSHEKGVDTLIRAMGMLDADLVPTLVVAGDGPLRDELETLAATEAPGRVTFVGRLTKSAVTAVTLGSSVAVVPSRWYENQPLAVLEAMGSGVPVVGTDLGGIPELVTRGVTGELVPADDPAALAAVLGRMLRDVEGTYRMGVAGRDRVLADFTTAKHLSGLGEIYELARYARHAGGRTS